MNTGISRAVTASRRLLLSGAVGLALVGGVMASAQGTPTENGYPTLKLQPGIGSGFPTLAVGTGGAKQELDLEVRVTRPNSPPSGSAVQISLRSGKELEVSQRSILPDGVTRKPQRPDRGVIDVQPDASAVSLERLLSRAPLPGEYSVSVQLRRPNLAEPVAVLTQTFDYTPVYRRHAIIVAMKNYQEQRGTKPLLLSYHDAKKLKDELVVHGYFPENINIITDAPDPQLPGAMSKARTADALIGAIRSAITDARKKGAEYLFFAFTGHGTNTGGDGARDILLPVDFDLEESSSYLRVEDLLALLVKTPSAEEAIPHVLVLLDSCRDTRDARFGLRLPALPAVGRGRSIILFSSCKPGDVSLELGGADPAHPQLNFQGGLFTEKFVKLLDSPALDNLNEFTDDLTQQVETVSQEIARRNDKLKGYVQTPVVNSYPQQALVYKMREFFSLRGQKPDNQQSDRKGVLEVRSEPPGAAILLDGQPTGKRTPDKLPIEAARNLQVAVQGAQPADFQQLGAWTAPSVTTQVSFRLGLSAPEPTAPPVPPAPMPALLRVTSDPVDAALYVDGSLQPLKTPAEVKVAVEAGTEKQVKIRLTKAGFKDYLVTVSVKPGQTLAQAFKLTAGDALKPAVLLVESDPTDAMVYVNDLPAPRRTPVELTLPQETPAEKQVKIRVSRDGFLDRQEFVSVKSGRSDRLTLKLEPAAVSEWKTRINPKDGAVMVYVPAGEFIMGFDGEEASDDEKPVRRIRLTKGFWIYQNEVTNEQYQKFVKAEKYDQPESASKAEFNRPQQPVTTVAHFDARAYARWAGGNLPTEAQWEYAARGPAGRLYPWGVTPPDESRAVLETAAPLEIGGRRAGASPFGLFDMLGNVAEWCLDEFKPYQDAGAGVLVQDDPVGSPKAPGLHVVRGDAHNYARYFVRASRRMGHPSEIPAYHIGFRVVLPE